MNDPRLTNDDVRVLKILIAEHYAALDREQREAELDEELAQIPTGGADEYGSID